MIADPYAIFAAAQRYWQAAVYPKKISYGVAVSVSRNAVAAQAHYHVWYDATVNRVRLVPVSDEELAHPYTPHGINFGISLFGGSIPLSSPQRTFDYLGLPVLVPNYSFGIVSDGAVNTTRTDAQLVQEIRKEFHDPMPARRAPSSGGLPTIAEVTVTHRQYVITLSGTQVLDGHPDFHLRLQPVSDPGTYRIREMWVNEATYATDRLITQGNFTAGAMGGVRWQIDYRQIADAPVIASEAALAGFTLDRRSYDSATVSFTDFAPVSSIPFPAFSLSPDDSSGSNTLTEPAKPPV